MSYKRACSTFPYNEFNSSIQGLSEALDAYHANYQLSLHRPSATGATNAVRQAPKGLLLQERPGVLPKLLPNRELSMEVVGKPNQTIKIYQNFRETFKHKTIQNFTTASASAFRRSGFGYGNPKIRYVPDLGPTRACKHSPPLLVNPDSENRSFPVIVCKWKTAPGPTGTASRPSGLWGWS